MKNVVFCFHILKMELSTYLEITVGFLCNQNCFVKSIYPAQFADILCLRLDFFKYIY